MHRWNRWRGRRRMALAAVSWLALSLGQAVSESGDLPKIGPAPTFILRPCAGRYGSRVGHCQEDRGAARRADWGRVASGEGFDFLVHCAHVCGAATGGARNPQRLMAEDVAGDREPCASVNRGNLDTLERFRVLREGRRTCLDALGGAVVFRAASKRTWQHAAEARIIHHL